MRIFRRVIDFNAFWAVLACSAASIGTAQAQDCDGNGVPDAIDATGALYITVSGDDTAIYRAPLSPGPHVPDLVYQSSGSSTLYTGLAIDKVNGNITLVNGANDWLHRINVDGTVFNGSFLAPTGNVRNDISLRVPGEFFYTDGNCVLVHPSGAFPGGCGLQFPYVLDTVADNSYIIYSIGDGNIRLITNQGGPSNQIQTIVNSVSFPGGIAYHNNQVFWTELSTGLVRRADISCDPNGCMADLNVTSIFSDVNVEPLGITVDRQNNKVYFVIQEQRAIFRCNPDGTDLQLFASFPPGVEPLALAVLPASEDCDGNGAIDECDPDCDNDGIPDVCELANGTAQDCDGNGIPDNCDIASGAASDCDGNGVPDSCDLLAGAPDCNGNGVPDSCDLVSNDCNRDGIPDDCQLAGNDCNNNGVVDECDVQPTYDQYNLEVATTGATNIATPRVQTFTPATSVLRGVEIGLDDGSAPLASDTLTVRIGNFSGLLAETSQEVLRPSPGTVQFYFDAPVLLTPGATYSLEVVSDAGELAFFWRYTLDDTYSGGARNFGGLEEGDWEFATLLAPPVARDCDGDGAPDACDPNYADCNGNGTNDACELVGNDCNNNGIPDDCDAAITDCNDDGIPDDCQLVGNDCNENGVPDDCELLLHDCNDNGVVDECEFGPVVDQAHLDDSGGGGNFQQGNNAGQTFTPDFELLEAIEVGLLDNTTPGNSEFITMQVLRGGTVLDTVGMFVTAPAPPLVRFDLNAPIVTTPGELLEFQLNDSGFIRFFWKQGPVGSSYAGGQGTFFGGSYNHDRVFQTLGRAAGWVDCDNNGVPDDCELLVRDCDNNGILDDCEVFDDCNNDDVPDTCQVGMLDCNNNGIIDDCESFDDCNADGVPDACQLAGNDCNGNGLIDACEFVGVDLFAFDFAGDQILSLDLNGNSVAPPMPLTSGSYYGPEADLFSGKLYYSNFTTFEIFRRNLDGSDEEVVIPQFGGRANAIAIDPVNDWLYWAQANNLNRARRDGTGQESLGAVAGSNGINGIALDVAGGVMYLADSSGARILTADLDGTNVQELVGSVFNASDLRADLGDGKLYFIRNTATFGRLHRVNTDGTALEEIHVSGSERIDGLTLDLQRGRLYFVGQTTNQLFVANLDGTDVTPLTNITVNSLFFVDGSQDCNLDSVPDDCQPDTDMDGLINACDHCAGGAASGDSDGDGFVGLADFGAQLSCLAGPGAGLGVGCECFDFDSDGDSDMADFLAFQEAFGS